jgi:PAS domain S-box-containing protein
MRFLGSCVDDTSLPGDSLRGGPSVTGRLRRFIEPAPDPVVVMDRSGVIVMVNSAANRVFGHSEEELIGQNLEILMPPEHRAAHVGLRTSFLQAPTVRFMGSHSLPRGLRRDGSCFPIEVSLSPLEDGEELFVCATVLDITDRREAEAIRLRLASLVDSAQDAIMSADLEGRIDSWNAAAERLFGYSAAEALGQSATFLKPPALVGQSGDRVARLHRGDTLPPSETIRRAKDGRDIEVLITHSAIRDPQGTLLGTSIVARDLTEQRKREADQFHLAAMINNSGAAIVGVNLAGQITSWNAASEKLFGYPAAEAIGQLGTFLVPPTHDAVLTTPPVRLGTDEAVPPYDAVRLRKDGSTVDVSVTPSVIRDATGAVVGHAAFIYDITERKRAERELAAAHEATLIASNEYESFAYAVAHDLRIPLRGIDGFVFLGQELYEAGQPEGARAHLDRARTAAQQMSRLIDALLRLAQVNRQQLSRTPVDLSACATTTITRLREDLPAREVNVIIQPGLTAIGDPDLLCLVVTNLIDNAWKFTRDHPSARIEFGGGSGRFFVKDNGAGFDMAHYDKLFGLFQRLHHQSEFEGTGIGLATSQRIVRRHGGRIWAESSPGAGTTFTFTLPPPGGSLS